MTTTNDTPSSDYAFPAVQPLGRAKLTHTRPLNLQKFLFGVCYYPEHWDEATRKDDAARMHRAGINVVRMAEFAWDLMEPEEGTFDFSLFDTTIERLAETGIQTILCTPTATPPRWLTCKHPEMLRQDTSGTPLEHGSRQHACYSSPIFRQHSRRVTRVMAEHYRNNPNVIGWQTDNEIYCHWAIDHSPDSARAFQAFLHAKFSGNISALNRAWGTAFWAQTYTSFDQIPTPKPDRPTHLNPAHLLDYARFLSEAAARFQHDQVEILRETNPAWFIFHNGIMQKTDYRGLFVKDLDFLGFDIYPFFVDDPGTRIAAHAFNLDRARSFAGNFLVPEHQCGPGGQNPYFHNNPEPGELRMLSWRSIARGADGFLYFRWRTCRFGAEQSWCGVLEHDNVPRRRYDEVAQLGNELKTIGELVLGTSVVADCAIATGDYDVREAHLTYPLGLTSEQNVAERVHRHLYEGGWQVGCVHPADDLHGLKLYIIPHWPLFDPAWARSLEDFVRGGGTLVVGARSGTRDLDNNIVSETPPGCLRSLCGVRVEEFGKQNAGSGRTLNIEWEGEDLPTGEWYEWVEPEHGTDVLARWSSRHLAGKPAITRRKLGEGQVIYVGTYFTDKLCAVLVPALARMAGLNPESGLPRGVEHVVRRAGGRPDLHFYINAADQPATVERAAAGRDCLADKPFSGGRLDLAPYGVAIVQAV